jgi:hypothetical protein
MISSRIAIAASRSRIEALLDRDVAHHDHEQTLAADVQLRDGGVRRELGAVLAERGDGLPFSHPARRDRSGREALHVLMMKRAQSFGDEDVERLADGFVAAPPEHLLGAVVEHEDELILVDGDDRVRGDRDEARELGCGPARVVVHACVVEREGRASSQLLRELEVIRREASPRLVACVGEDAERPAPCGERQEHEGLDPHLVDELDAHGIECFIVQQRAVQVRDDARLLVLEDISKESSRHQGASR